MTPMNKEYWPKGPAESSRVREFAETQWKRVHDEVPREKSVFLHHLRDITDSIIGKRPVRSQPVEPIKLAVDEVKTTYPINLTPELRVASAHSLSSLKKIREQVQAAQQQPQAERPINVFEAPDRSSLYSTGSNHNATKMQTSSKQSVSAASNNMSEGPKVRWTELTDSHQPQPPPQRSVVDLLRPSQKLLQKSTLSHSPAQPAQPQPPVEEELDGQQETGDDESADQSGPGEEGERSEAEEDDEDEDDSRDGENDSVDSGTMGAEIPTPAAAAIPGHALTTVPMPLPAAAATAATEEVTPPRLAPSRSFSQREHIAPVAAPPRPTPAADKQTAPINTDESAEPMQWSEQARRLQLWEAELRERERQLLEYKDSISRPIGAKLPPRSPATAATARLSDYYSSRETTTDSTIAAAQENNYVYPYDRVQYDPPAAVAPRASRQPDIHIHNHLPPPAVPSASATQRALNSSWEAGTSVGASSEKVRFPYDRRVDYDSATGYPSAIPSVYDVSSATPATAQQAPPRTGYQVDYSSTTQHAPETATKSTGSSFEDRHQLFARVSYEFPSWRDSASHRPSSSTNATPQQNEWDGEEVNLSGLSLQRMRELTGHY